MHQIMPLPIHLDCGLPQALRQGQYFLLRVRLVLLHDGADFHQVEVQPEADNWFTGGGPRTAGAIKAAAPKTVDFNLKPQEFGTVSLGVWIRGIDGRINRPRVFRATLDLRIGSATTRDGTINISVVGKQQTYTGEKAAQGQLSNDQITLDLGKLPIRAENEDGEWMDMQWIGFSSLEEHPAKDWPVTARNRPSAAIWLTGAAVLMTLAFSLVWGMKRGGESPGHQDPPPQAPQARSVPKLVLNKPSYRHGDTQTVTVEAPADGFLYVASFCTDGAVYVYFPNKPGQDARVKKGQTIRLPDNPERPIKVFLPHGSAKIREYVFATLSGRDYPEILPDTSIDQRRTFEKLGLLHAYRGSMDTVSFPTSEIHATAAVGYPVEPQ